MTIDGADARDFDDAVYAESARRGWRLLVAIADVAEYVQADSRLDHCARERGASVYFPGRVLPMLPEVLSNGVCSLTPNSDRLALVCDMQINRDGSILEYRFVEAVIRSQRRLTYSEVETLRQHQFAGLAAPVAASLEALHGVYRALHKARKARGALDIEIGDGRPQTEGGEVVRIVPVKRLQSHRLIEEAMIAANHCAARFVEEAGATALHRVHPPPEPEKAAELRNLLTGIGLPSPGRKPRAADLQRCLTAANARADGWLAHRLILRSLGQARYTPDNQGHFALALDYYAHFTSPIRRYPDLLLHRTLKGLLRDGKAPEPVADPELLGQEASAAERRAEAAERNLDAWLKCSFLASRLGDTFAARVAGVTDFGLFAELDDFYVQGLVHVSMLGDEYFRSAAPLALTGEASGKRFALGDALAVQLVRVDPEAGRLELVLPNTVARPPGRRGRSRYGRLRR